MQFENLLAAIPASLATRSGKVFYSGRSAFTSPALLYVLGANPGGDPSEFGKETVASHSEWIARQAPGDWSAYRDESWKGRPPGEHGMQPRMLHLLRNCGLNPGSVPASNVVFVRSRREGDLVDGFERLADECWSFHAYVLRELKPKVVLCLGKTAGDYVRSRLGAHRLIGTFTENNSRRWQSHSYIGGGNQRVVVATHPSIAAWTAPAADPTGLVEDALRAV